MPGPFYPVSAEVEGRSYSGTWTLKQGGRICVSWPAVGVPARTVDLGGAQPNARAQEVLKDMVAGWLEEQRQPKPKPKPPPRPRAPAPGEDKQPADRETLRRLVAEIAVGDYRDPLGHRLVQNTAYLEAVALLGLADYLEGRPAGTR